VVHKVVTLSLDFNANLSLRIVDLLLLIYGAVIMECVFDVSFGLTKVSRKVWTCDNCKPCYLCLDEIFTSSTIPKLQKNAAKIIQINGGWGTEDQPGSA